MKFLFPSIFNSIMTIQDKSIQQEIQELCETENYQINRQQEERMTEFEQRFAPTPESKASKAKRARKYKDNNNVAIKCNYCDGGMNDQTFGYKGVCSDEVLRQNVSVIKRPWCSAAECECKRYTKGEINRAELEQMNQNGTFICYESRLLKDWVASIGRVQREKRTDKPK
ncbi:MAG: hypothetical protein PHW41_10425, partial [Eubacteriales bacterium]|nr:hypothetical protein [Eubacteriales bacterium]